MHSSLRLARNRGQASENKVPRSAGRAKTMSSYHYRGRAVSSKEDALPLELLQQLTSPPDTNRHQWLFVMALKLLRYRTKDQTLELLTGAAKHITRAVPQREISSAVDNAALVHREPRLCGTYTRAEHKWPEADLSEVDGIVRRGARQAKGIAMSPLKFIGEERHTEAVIDSLFPNNPLLCAAHRGSWDFCTAQREAYRGRLHLCQFIVPSPMCALSGLTQDGRASAHTKQNTGPRHYLVIEFDFTATDEAGHPTKWAPLIAGWGGVGITIADACMALLLHLAKSAPLALIVYSGGKSSHGWFRAKDRDETKLHRWMRYAVSLGACHSTWCRSQFVRMPDGTRYPGRRRQQVLYFDPGTLL